MHDEMPGFFPGRPGGERDEPLLDMLLERRPIPPGAPSQLHDLARLLAAAAGPAEPGDLAGEDAARAAFRRLPSPAGVSHAAPWSARHRLTAWPARGRLPLAAALAVAAAGLGSATAAYVGALPSPIQHFAHEVIGAPPPPGISGQPLVVSSSPTTPDPRTSTPAARKTLRVYAASSSPKPSNWQWRSRNPRYSPGPTFASCHPTPGPTQSQAHPTPTPSPGHPSPVPGSVSPSPSQHPGRSLPAQDLAAPRPSASTLTPSPSGTSCPSLPGKVPPYAPEQRRHRLRRLG
jgi:hypothetical protein